MNKIKLLVILICFILSGAIAQAQNTVVQPGKAQLPAWLREGKIHFARFDGGPIEVQKTERSLWGERFTPQQTAVLGNVYGKYGDRMVDLLTQAHVNFVWVTYSVGFSWQDEAAQRAAVREIVRKLHSHGIHVAAYMCAVSVFWQSMFKDVPQSVRWIMFNPQGFPYRYSGGRDPLRFIADLRNPGWIAYQEKRVGGIADDGLDAVFFDNTSSPEWASNQAVANFFTQIHEFLHNQKHSSIPLFSNFGLPPSRVVLNRYMNFTFDEHWQEPGVWGSEWNVSNVRRDRLLHGMLPPWKPIVSEYSMFHSGDRATTFLSPRSEKLSITEAAAFGTSYAWDMEGPFDASLIARAPRAMASWSAIGHYNGFIENHSSLYVGAVNITPLLVLIPDGYPIGFAWTNNRSSSFFDFLSRHSILYSARPANDTGENELKSHAGIVIPFFSELTSGEKHLLRRYQAQGGRVYAFAKQSDLNGLKCELSSPTLVAHLEGNTKGQQEVLAKLSSLGPGATRIELSGASHVLANVTSLGQGKGIVVHLLNYNPNPVAGVHFRLSLGERFHDLAGRQPRLFTPDSKTSPALSSVSWKGTTLEATLPALGTYAAIYLH
ncbi:MAG: hypothetical protein ACRD2B_08790 [Terriglobia bacterium]